MNIQKCRECGATIVMLKTRKGRFMPVNRESAQQGDTAYIPTRHVSHFATCTQPGRFRRQRQP